jgi:hypothetical protein
MTMHTITLELSDDDLVELAVLLRYGWPVTAAADVERAVDDALLRASPRLWVLARLADVRGDYTGRYQQPGWNDDEPSPGSIVETLLDEYAAGWRTLDRSTFMRDVLDDYGMPMFKLIDERRCPATTRRGNRCRNGRTAGHTTCRTHDRADDERR